MGEAVRSVAPGDEVFGWCPYKTAGAFAEYVLVSEDTVARKPAEVSFEEAACLPMAGTTAFKTLVGKGRLAAGEKVLVNGCTGGVGLFALQVAGAQGAIVTGTCSTKKVEIAKQFGAKFDVILEASGKLK